jgi:hypothetical protein
MTTTVIAANAPTSTRVTPERTALWAWDWLGTGSESASNVPRGSFPPYPRFLEVFTQGVPRRRVNVTTAPDQTPEPLTDWQAKPAILP